MTASVFRSPYPSPVVIEGAAALARVERELEARFPTRMVPDLDRITDLMDLLGQPQRAYPSIHLTGTNGKTTTARMIDALLREFGLRTGRYTSPHLQSVTERIALDGTPLSAEQFAEVYDDIAPLVEVVDGRHPDKMTFFELLTAMAFAAFADAPVDIGVIEVGLGGRWDATNVIHAPVAVVTSIGLDHVGILGSTVAEIAGEKAGIIHEGATVVSAGQTEDAALVLTNRVAEVGARLAREGLDFGVRRRSIAVGGQSLDLTGLGATMTTSSCRSTALTRRPMPPVRSLRWKRSSAPRTAGRSTSTWCGRPSPRCSPRDGWRSCGDRRPSCSTERTTRPAPRRWRQPSRRRS